jgi:hypothetical protein
MFDIDNLASQIKMNCNISDAQFWGTYSLCGLLLRLRELYRSENGLGAWEKISQKDIGAWIIDRESLWRELEERDYKDITLNGNTRRPFEVEKINSELAGKDLIYGAGFGLHGKPSFFLADLISKRTIDGYDVYVSGREYAKDLSEYPALLQDRSIFSRTEPIKRLLWQRFEEMRGKSIKCDLLSAFSKYGLSPQEEPSEDVDGKISQIADSEAETYIHHELGEAFEGEKIGAEWKNLLSVLPHSKAELFARAVKDVLSDTSEKGMLQYIIKTRKEGSLGFYMVFLSGFRKIIFSEIPDAFRLFSETGDWTLIDDARKTGYRKAEDYAEKLLLLYRKKKDDDSLSNAIENEFLRGLF